MDGASALAILASAIEVTRFTIDVAARLKSFLSKTEGVPEALRLISVRVPLLALVLGKIQDEIKHNQPPESELLILEKVLGICCEDLQVLKSCLENLLPHSGDAWSTTVKKAIKSLGSDTKIKNSFQVIEQCFSGLTSYQSTLNTSKLNQMLDFSSQVVEPSSQTTSQIEKILTIALIKKPGLLQQQLDEKDIEDDQHATFHSKESALAIPNSHSGHISRVGLVSPEELCFCQTRKPAIVQKLSFQIPNTEFSYRVSNPHRRGCPFHYENRNTKQASVKFTIPNILLKRTMILTWLSTYGAGGFSISGNLRLRGVVRKDSPAFALIEDRFKLSHQTVDLDQVYMDLSQLFQEGLASPTELDTYGDTILSALSERFVPEIKSPKDLQKWVLLIQRLVDLGAPLNETPSGLTVIDINLCYFALYPRGPDRIFTFKDYQEFRPLFTIGGEMTLGVEHWMIFGIRDLKLLVGLLRYLPDYAESLNCNRLQMALLAKSREEVELHTRIRPSILHDRNTCGQQALHLAADWPWATQYLLSHGADLASPDRSGYLPLSYAVQWHNSEVVSTLLAAHSPLITPHNAPKGILKSNKDCPRSVWSDVGKFFDHKVFSHIVQVLAHRRKALRVYASEHLSADALQKIHVVPGTIPDLEAMEMLQLLEQTGHHVDRQYFLLDGTSVYQFAYARHETLQMIFDAGFTNVVRSLRGNLSLIEVLHSLDYPDWWALRADRVLNPSLYLWLYEKGASLSHSIPRSDLHDRRIFIIHESTLCVASDLWWDRLSGDGEKLLQLACSPCYSACKDSCRCLCTPDGCTPWTNFLKTLIDLWSPGVGRFLSKSALEVERLVQKMENSGSEAVLKVALIRVLIFTSLGLRHVCCRTQSGSLECAIDEDEAREIQEEDRHLAQQFHELLPKAMIQLHETSLPLLDFWRAFHKHHIRPKMEEFDEDHIRTIQELGVRVEEMRLDRDELDSDGEETNEEHGTEDETEEEEKGIGGE